MSENYTLINWQNGEITQPAVVEIDGVDYQVQPAIETGNTPINADNLNHMDNGIRNATLKLNDKIETATVQLIAVTDTAPSECAENDKYYNTNTNLIYTATGTDTWGVTGETPSQLYLYMDISDEKLYYYDGNTFSSYGGGSGGTGGETLPVGSQIGFDGSVSDIPTGWEQVDDPNEYSTTETIVGTWINSKPIYRKVISQNITYYTGDINIDLNTANIELFTDARVLVDTDSFTSVTHSQPSTNFYIRNFVFRKSANNNTVTVSTNIEGLSGTIYVIIEYTKTTD